MSSPLRTRHPVKFLYTAWFVASLPLRLLATLVYYLPSATRSSRTYRQAVATKLVQLWITFATAVEFRKPPSLEPGADKSRFVLLDPDQIDPSNASQVGVLTVDPAIRPAPIAGFWYESPPPPDETPALTVLHFHGGAFVLGGARPADAGCGPLALSRRLECPVLMPEYRLSNSRDRTACFPAALQDSVTAYTYLLNTLRMRPEDVVLSGDSAGGNLVLALLRYLEDPEGGKKARLPLPRAALLWGPWVNLDVPGSQMDRHRNIPTDFIFGALGDWGVRCYVPGGWDVHHQHYAYVAPLGRELFTKVPLFVQTGTGEVLYDSHVEFAQNAREKGCKVELVEIPKAPHDTFLGGDFLGFGDEQEDAIDQAAKVVEEGGRRLESSAA
ncbi:hypothetical protein G6O67_007909 [Ophiocordyceps sinensis]|uniref:Alpha/beta hydrolase fold-3 domain-containing protein n=1 Tax=Ophiocordyceps sinensis TaxID=72228 RepID=A0A8H4PKG9_9HYPO|nr:hypothetical protein G6O67_007909 [Ophiocordyceps sinensis]